MVDQDLLTAFNDCIDRLAAGQVNVEAAAGGAEAADHGGGRIGLEPGRHLPETEPAWFTKQLTGQRTVRLVQEGTGAVEQAHVPTRPGILGRTTAAKNR